MIFPSEKTEEILDSLIGGFRQYRLQEPISLAFVSQNLCDMIGCSKEELLCEKADRFASFVHPADKANYSSLFSAVLAGQTTATAEYRLLKKDGSVVYVCDTIRTAASEDGTLVGYAVLSDISAIKAENDSLRFLNETVPCGMLKYTCEKNPRITYINEQMRRIMRFPAIKEGETDYWELCKDNIYLMIPMEERHRFSHFLNRVYTKGSPVAGELSMLCCDGSKVRLYGWVTKVTHSDGTEEFQSVCMDITEHYHTKRADETERYLKALSEVYDKIFEYDFANKTVKYVHANDSDTFDRIRNIPMQMEEATEQWIQNTVDPDDRQKVQNFFARLFRPDRPQASGKPLQIRFRSLSAGGNQRIYNGILLKIDSHVSLFCCRSVQDEYEANSLRNENLSLKNLNENMQEMVMRFTDGLAAFEVTADRVTPLYASDNVCEFFGFSKEEWLPMMKQSNSIRDFVSRSGVGYEKFSELLANGEAEFTYFDINTGIKRRIKAICSQKHSDGTYPRYVMLYNVDTSRDAYSTEKKERIYIRTFGYFDVFVEDKPIAFRNKKAKELLALLVDRRGGYVSSEEAISFLWEEEAVNAVTLARYRKEALRLKNTLEEYGITDIMESVDGKRRIVPEKVRCDLYDYLSQKEEYAQLFKGSYLTNYSWGETTLGELLNENLY